MADDPKLTSGLLAELGWVRRLAAHLADADAADDLTQEVAAAALRKPPALDLPLKPWLAAVARKLAHTRARSEARRHDRERAVEAAGGDEPADARLEKAELLCLVAELVSGLAEPYRATVLLRYYEGLSSREIAARQGVSDGTVRWRLKEAIAQLRTRLDARVQGGRRAWCVALARGAGPMTATLKIAATVVAVALAGVVAVGVARRAPSRAVQLAAGPTGAAGSATGAAAASSPQPPSATAADPPATGGDLERAQAAYIDGRFAEAIRLARPATGGGQAPKAWRIVGASSCFLHDGSGAAEAWHRLDARGQKFLEYVCKRHDVVIPPDAHGGAGARVL